MIETNNEKLYIVTLIFGNQEKRLYLVGESGGEGESKFQLAKEGLTEVGDASSDIEDYVGRAVQHFKRVGFARIRR